MQLTAENELNKKVKKGPISIFKKQSLPEQYKYNRLNIL
jgi:hypothetical protein